MNEPVILWIFHASALYFVGVMGELISLYDCVDYVELRDDEKLNLEDLEKQLLTKVNYVFANSAPLAATKNHIRKDIQVVPCGCALDLFPAKYKPKEKPLSIRRIKSPIVGFHGHIDYRLDFPLLEWVVKHNQNISFVIIGKILDKQLTDKSNKRSAMWWNAKLSQYPNYFFISEVKKEELKDYIFYFDGAIMPYDHSLSVVRFANPMKFYEYMAMGIPVVSVPIPSLLNYKLPTIQFAKDYDQFNQKLHYILDQKNIGSNLRYQMYQIARKNSWSEKVETILSTISN